MERTFPLCALFCPALPPGAAADPAVLEPALEAFLSGAQGEHRGATAPESLLPYVAARCPAGCDVAAQVSALHAADLALACASLRGDRAALQSLEDRYLCRLAGELRRSGLPADVIEDGLQACRERLLVGSPARAPRLADYNGTSPLWSWLRVVALREALQILRKGRRETSLPAAILDVVAPESDPELACLKQTLRAAFRDAFARAVASLSAQERSVLRQHFVYGLTIDQIGALHEVHRATAARWLQRIRDLLLVRTREDLIGRLRLSDTEFEGVLSLVRSQLDLSSHRHLGASGEAP